MAPRKKRKPFGFNGSGFSGSGFSQSGFGGTGFSGQKQGPLPELPKGDDDGGVFDDLLGAGKVVLDVLSAPQRAVGGMVLEAKEDGFQPTDLITGFKYTFDEKADPSNVLEIDNFWGALAADVLLDPLAALAAPKLAVTGAKLAKAGKEATTLADKTADAAKVGTKVEPKDVKTRRVDEVNNQIEAERAREAAARKVADETEASLKGKPKNKKERKVLERRAQDKRAEEKAAFERRQALQREIDPEYQQGLKDEYAIKQEEIAKKEAELAGNDIDVLAAAGRQVDRADSLTGSRSADEVQAELDDVTKQLDAERAARDEVARSGNVISKRQENLAKTEEELAQEAAEAAVAKSTTKQAAERSADETAEKLTKARANRDELYRQRQVQQRLVNRLPQGSKLRKTEQTKLNALNKKWKTAGKEVKALDAEVRTFQKTVREAAPTTFFDGLIDSADDLLGTLPFPGIASATGDFKRLERGVAKKTVKRDELREQVAPDKVARWQQASENILDLGKRKKALEKELRQAQNPRTIERGERLRDRARTASQGARERLGLRADAPLNPRDSLLAGMAAPIDEGVSLAAAANRSRQLEGTLGRLRSEADELGSKILSPEEIAAFQDESAALLRQGTTAGRRAEKLESILDTDVQGLTRTLRAAQEEVLASSTKIDELNDLAEKINSKPFNEWNEDDLRLLEILDGPAMREVGSDFVQRRLVLRFFGIPIPGIPKDWGIPLGRIYSKSERKAAFARKHPTLAKMRDAIGQTFNTTYDIAPELAALEQGRSNVSKAVADRAVGIASKYFKKIDRETRQRISLLVMRADEDGLDLATQESRNAAREGLDLQDAQRQLADAEAAAGSVLPLSEAEALLKGAREAKAAGTRGPGQPRIGDIEKQVKQSRKAARNVAEAQKRVELAEALQAKQLALLDEFDELSDVGKEAVEFVLQTYRKDAKIDVGMGLIKPEAENAAYSSRLRPLTKEGDELYEDPIIMRSNDEALIREQGFSKSRTMTDLENAPDFLQAFMLRQVQAAQMRQGFAMVNSISNEFGVVFKNADEAAEQGFVRPEKVVALRWLPKDTYVPEEIAESLDLVHQVWSSPRVLNQFTRKWSILNGQFKNLAYSVNLGHLTIDAIGDTWNMWLARVPVFSPKYGPYAARAMKDIESYERAIAQGKTPEKTTVKLADGKDYEIRDLILMLDAKGLRNRGRSAGRTSALDNPDGEYLLPGEPGKVSPRRGARATTDFLQNVGNFRDNTFRSYGMITQLQKNLDDGMEYGTALNAAGGTIRFSTFDYNDLTPVEKRVFRNVIPFYTWSRKNIPYQLNRLMETPGRVTLPFKVQEALQERDDAPDLSLLQPFTRNSSFFLPDAISENIPGLGGADIFVNPMIPSMDLGRFQTFRIDGEEGPIPGFDAAEPIGMLSPYIKAPFEIAMGREFFSGREIGSNPSYLMRTFLGQPGSQVVRLGAPNTSGYDEIDVGPLDLRRSQIFGLLGQNLGFRGTAIEEGPASAARAARLQAIQLRKAEREEARREAGNLFSLPLIGTDVPNPFRY